MEEFIGLGVILIVVVLIINRFFWASVICSILVGILSIILTIKLRLAIPDEPDLKIYTAMMLAVSIFLAFKKIVTLKDDENKKDKPVRYEKETYLVKLPNGDYKVKTRLVGGGCNAPLWLGLMVLVTGISFLISFFASVLCYFIIPIVIGFDIFSIVELVKGD